MLTCKILLAFSFVLLALTQVSAAELLVGEQNLYRWKSANQDLVMPHLMSDTLIKQCELIRASAGDHAAFAKCAKEYEAIAAKDRVKISYHVGYLDGGRTADDPYDRASLILHLVDDKGFVQDPEDENKLTKTIPWGPKGEMKTFEVSVFDSAISTDHRENKKMKKAQALKSEKARAAFKQSLAEADVVLYNGHSRNGGGPDFFPPSAKLEARHDYSDYRKTRVGLQDVLDGLKQRSEPMFMLGLLSCNSDLFFRRPILNAQKPPARIMGATKDMRFDEGYKSTLAVIDGLMKSVCNVSQSSFLDRNVKAVAATKAWGSAQPQLTCEKAPALSEDPLD